MSEPQQRRLARWLNVFGAVLIVAGIIGVSFSVARSTRTASSGTATWGDGGPFTRVALADGLYFVMKVTPGPYFLGELVAADLSLTNSSQTTYTLDDSCGDGLYATISGGTGPHFALPALQQFYSCPFISTPLKPGQVLTSRQLLPLSSSGEVILQSRAAFLRTYTGPDGEQVSGPAGHSPLDGQWPSLTLSVAPVAPLDQRITLQQTGATVHVQAPLSARSSLYYIYTLGCSDPINDPQAGTAVDTITGWQSLARTVLHEPACGGGEDPSARWSTVHWSYAVSAPGFSIAAGEQG